MEQKTANLFIAPSIEREQFHPSIRGFILILFSILGFSITSFAQNAALSLDQGANGAVNAATSPVTWQNGNVNANQAHYVEGHSVPYRAIMTGLTAGDTVTLTMQFDITQSNAYALDFITGDSNLTPHTFLSHSTPEAVNPLSSGVSGVPNTPDFLRISIPTFISNNLAVPGAQNALNHFKSICDYSGTTPINANNKRNSISIYGATFVQSFGVQYSYGVNVLNLAAADQQVNFTVRFVPNQSTVVMAWGGHISRFVDWGGNKTAALINGSPYHMRAQSWSPPSLGNIGNQDRALQTSAAIIPPACPGELSPPLSMCANAQGTLISCPASACAGATLYYKIPQDSKATTFVWFVSPSTGVTITPLTADPNDSFVSITFANAGSYQINVALSNSSTFQDTCRANVTINPPPTCSITGKNSICSYDSTSFSGPAGMDSYSWTGPAGFTANTQSTGKITQQGTYSLTITKNGCSSTCTRDLLVNLGAPPPNATPGSRCGPGMVTLTAVPNGAYDSVLWYSDAAQTNKVSSGLTYSPNLTATTTFYAVVVNSVGCSSLSAPATATINPVPAAPVPGTSGSGDTRCDTGIVNLHASSSDTSCKIIFWFADSARTMPLATGPDYSPSLQVTTTFWVSCQNKDSCFGPSVPVTGTINPVPAKPSATGDARCDTGVVNLHANSNSANCDSLIWYSDPARTARVNVGPNYSPHLQATTTFYVVCKSSKGCVSDSVRVTGTINPRPAKPTTTSDARCDTGVVNLHANSNDPACDSLIWYSDPARTVRVNVGNNYSPHLQATTTFYVVCKSVKGCISDSAQVKGTINPLPAKPTTTNDTRCDTGVVNLHANSNNPACDSLIWYSDPARTVRVNVGNNYSPHLQTTTTFYVVCKSVKGCISDTAQVKGIINGVSPAPVTTSRARCDTGVVNLSASSGSSSCDSLIWYSNQSLTTRVNVGPNYSPHLMTTTTFWVVCKSVSGCVSPAASVTGTINPVPAAPAPISRSRCDTGVVNLGATGSANCDSLIWYSDQSLTTRVNVGSSYSPHLMTTTTFWVVCKSVNGCVSPATAVTGTINPAPAAPAVTPGVRCGPGTATMVATPGANCDSLLWFSSAALTTRVFSGTSYSPNLSSTTSFWVVCKTVNGCLSAPTMVTDTINPVPVLQLAPVQVCKGAQVTLTATPSGGIWSSPQLGVLTNGLFDASLLAVGNYKVGYSVTNQYGCSKTDSLTVTVTNCGPITCSYTQGYYGSTGKSCDGDTTYQSAIALITKLLSTNLVIGIGPKSVLIPVGSAATVNAVMPGGNTPTGLTYNGQCTISTVTGSCFQTNYLTKQGRINNVLLSQTIALSFNTRMRGGVLLGVPIQPGYLVTQSTTGCGSNASTVPCSVNINTLTQNLMPTSVANYLTNNGLMSATVADLLTLANSVLGGALTPGQPGANNLTVPSYADVNNAVSAINQAFDECDVFIGYNVPLCPAPLRPSTTTSVYAPITAGQFTVYPNPTHGTFTVESPENMTNTVITVLDLNGRVIARQNVAATGHTVFNLENVTSGVYVIYISDGKEAFHVKIMVL